MDFETLFSIVGLLAMAGWLMLIASPYMPQLSDVIAGLVIPLALSVGYVVLIIFFPVEGEGGFGSFADVAKLFSHPQALMAGWIHFLAFDLAIGAWICRIARREKLTFWLVPPCLLLAFLFGPAGFLAFNSIRAARKLKTFSS